MGSAYIDIRRQLHQIPEPGFEEFKTQAFVLDFLAKLPQEHLEVQTWRTGVLALIRGTGSGDKRILAYRADMDGLPIEEETSYPFRSQHPGYMHACGHDMHTTVALGVAEHFASHPLEDDVLIVFQPAEEGPGGAAPMMASEPFAAWRPDFIMALHIAPEYPVGTVATRPGILFANTSELFIDVIGTGGHAAFPHQANDAMIAAANLIVQLQSIVSRNVNPLDSAVITLGKITGGVRQNVIAERVRLEGTIRTLSEQAMNEVKGRVEAMLRGVETGFGIRTELDYGANYHQVYNAHDETAAFMNWVQESNCATLVECTEAMTGEDYGYFLKEIPGFMFWLGVDTPYGLHHSKIEPSEDAIEVAISIVTRYLTAKSASDE